MFNTYELYLCLHFNTFAIRSCLNFYCSNSEDRINVTVIEKFWRVYFELSYKLYSYKFFHPEYFE
jgi:hypothetical protein